MNRSGLSTGFDRRLAAEINHIHGLGAPIWHDFAISGSSYRLDNFG